MMVNYERFIMVDDMQQQLGLERGVRGIVAVRGSGLACGVIG